ncbi:MAG: sulfite exporter TauE/SafE family protein [Anaerolineae bacterium]
MATLLQTLILLGTGIVLGLEHALETDHIVAVVTLTSQTKSVRRAVLLGVSWGLGHALTLIVIGFIILVTRLVIPEQIALLLEMLVGVVLIGLGIDTAWKALKGDLHYHTHEHDGVQHTHLHSHHHTHDHAHHTRRSFLVGVVHGLAGSAALVLLVVSTFDSVGSGVAFIVCFGLGSVIGMALIQHSADRAVQTDVKFERLNSAIRVATGSLSVVVGAALIYNIGFVEGLFLRGA